jgi:hypothetical protein
LKDAEEQNGAELIQHADMCLMLCRHLTVRKIKSGNTKLAFLTLLSPVDRPDWRTKLLAQHHFNTVGMGACCLGFEVGVFTRTY